jgi:membrane protease YdiL (CAAX protease family)
VAPRGSAALTGVSKTPVDRPRLWPVFLSCVAAFVTIVAFSLLAVAVVRSQYPDVPDRVSLEGFPGLLAGSIASSSAFLLTTLVASGGPAPAALRLVPGRESGRTLVLALVGMLALGQTLDSLTELTGLARHGNMAMIRNALAQVAGPDLFLAVLIVGVMAGSAEEIFFRGYMQTRLVQRLPRGVTVLITSLCFGVFHLDWLHGLLALILGLYLGWLTELTGSALPAVACHVINNTLFTVLTATWGTVGGFELNVALGAAGAVVFVGVIFGLRRAPSGPAEGTWLTSVAVRVWKRFRR